MNQKDGFDCMSCAWPDPAHRRRVEFCENGARRSPGRPRRRPSPTSFWAEHSLTDLLDRSEYWLGQQGRLVEPVHKPAGSDHYVPISWDDAFRLVADKLRGLDSPDQAAFYTSGRTSNETAFVYQLFVRAFGTNNLPDCSNMCHESTGTAMLATIGVGKSTIAYDDFAQADLIIVMGQNPGTNHPRMLTALEDAKRHGATIVSVNPLPEAGLRRYKNPQTVRGRRRPRHRPRRPVPADPQRRRHGAAAVASPGACSRPRTAHPGTVLDHEFLAEHTLGLDELRAHLATLDEQEVLTATGLTAAEIDELADRYLAADRVIITWAMGLTQHRKGVDTIKEIVNLLLLRGNIGKPGAGASPIRGHSNVQGDRTMGIWERMPDSFLDALGAEFAFEPPRRHGLDSVQSIEAMRRGEIKVWFALGGNLVAAISDTAAAEAAMRGTDLTVQVSTKLNRSHVVTGAEALILPTLGRTDVDLQADRTAVRVRRGHRVRRARDPRPAPAGLGPAALRGLDRHAARARRPRRRRPDRLGRLRARLRHHPRLDLPRRARASRTSTAQVRRAGGFVLPNGPRDSRTFPTPTGKAMLTVNELVPVECPPGRLILQTIRSHDQFNTTMYSLNDRYRGIRGRPRRRLREPRGPRRPRPRRRTTVDVLSEWPDGADRVLRDYRVVAYPTARGCAAAYFPEANVLVPLGATAEGSNTPVSKAVVVRLEPALERDRPPAM